MDWLQNHIWPAEAKHVSDQFVHDGTLLACAEMLRGGTTCFNDMYFYPKATARAALTSGMRATIGLITIDFPTAYATDADDYLAKGLAVRDELRDEPLINFCLAPHAPYTVNDRNFAKVLKNSQNNASYQSTCIFRKPPKKLKKVLNALACAPLSDCGVLGCSAQD